MLMKKYEFKPDPSGRNWIDKLYISRQQRSFLLKWTLYSVLCVFLLVVQDVVFSRLRPFGGTVDLLVAGLLLICLKEENTYQGGLFVLIASLIYLFSGSAPGHYVIALLTILGVLAAIFCRSYLQEGFFPRFICAAVAIVLYELGVFGIALLQERAIIGAFPRVMVTALNTVVAMLVEYPMIRAIGGIGGQTWKD